MKKMPIGVSDFKELMENDFFFVDKSLFIKEIIEEDSKVTLLPRPRRFGKTLNLSMLRHFFEKPEPQRNDEGKATKNLFSNLLISKESVFSKHLGRYPVIYLTFKDIKSLDFDDALESIKLLIAKEYRRHGHLLKSEALDDFEKEDFQNIAAVKAGISLFERSLLDLSHYLYKHHNERPVILIDEYDTPMHHAYAAGHYEKTSAFFRSFLSAGLKDNPDIFKGVLTGILRIAKESIFSDMNNLGVYSILREEYSDCFGFTEPEMEKLAGDCDASDHLENMKRWYNGYRFGRHVIYNPWSILNFVGSKDKLFRPYWANTSSNVLIKDLLKKAPPGVKEEFYNLLKDIPIVKRVEENIDFENLGKNDVAIYNFFLFCGYLKADQRHEMDNETYCSLSIPNIEVKQIIKHVILEWINEGYKDHDKLRHMLEALIQGDIDVFGEILSDFVVTTLSYFDTAGKKNVERVYQAFILGLLVNLSLDYEVTSEKESGFGRYDISLIPKETHKKAVIMELKTIASHETKDAALKSALAQIEDKKYETDIIKRGILDIVKLGVVFDGKRVWVARG